MPEIFFEPLPWLSRERCACGEIAVCEMWIDQEREALCPACYQLEAGRISNDRREWLCDLIHRTWLRYPWEADVCKAADSNQP